MGLFWGQNGGELNKPFTWRWPGSVTTSKKYRPLAKTLSDQENGPQNGGVVFALCRSSFTAETKGPKGTVENFRFLNLTGKHSCLKDSSDMRQVTNLKGLHYESVVEEAVFSNNMCPCSWKGTAATPALSVTEERTHQVHAFTFIYTHFTNTLVPFLTHSKSNSGSGLAGALHEQRSVQT